MATTAIRARRRPYSTMLAPRSSLANFACSQVLRTKRFTQPTSRSSALCACPLMIEVSSGGSPWLIGRSVHCRPDENSDKRYSVDLNDAHSDCTHDGLRAVAGVEFLVDRREVVLHGLGRDVE